MQTIRQNDEQTVRKHNDISHIFLKKSPRKFDVKYDIKLSLQNYLLNMQKRDFMFHIEVIVNFI